MKTSAKLILLLAVVTLTGLVSVNGLLKQQYNEIDWSNPYQTFLARPIPARQHIRITGTPEYEIRIEPGPTAQALLHPTVDSSVLKTERRGDTLVVTFNKDGRGWEDRINAAGYNGPIGLVLRVPVLSSLSADNVRVALHHLNTSQLTLSAHHARLRTAGGRVTGQLTVRTERQGAAQLTLDTCGTLVAFGRDTSSLDLTVDRLGRLSPTIDSGSDLRIRGRALALLRQNR